MTSDVKLNNKLVYDSLVLKRLTPSVSRWTINRVCGHYGVLGLVPCNLTKSLQLIWRSVTHKWNLWVPNLQVICSSLTHWGRVTHICVFNLTIIGSDNGLSPDRRQAIIRTNAGILLIGPLGTNFSEILIGIQTFSFKKMHLKMASAKWRPFCLGLNVLTRMREHLGSSTAMAANDIPH